jgi:hypothetical protein
MGESTNSVLDAARRWLERGYYPIPVPFRKKAPVIDGWPKLRLTSDQLPQYFNGRQINIGVLLGDPEGNADIDLDAQQARHAWRVLRPETGLVFGRASAPASHHFFRADPPLKTAKYVDPVDKKSLIELRCLASDGAVGLQTIVPPSVHESGEAIRFDIDGAAQNIDADALSRATAQTAAAALFGKHWPAQGSRNAAFLALAGGLARAAWSEKDAVTFHRALYQCLWPDSPDFLAAEREVANTFRRLRDGQEITAFRRLSELIDKRAVHTALRWLDITSEPEPSLATPRIALVDLNQLQPSLELLNAQPVFGGRIQFRSVRRRGPMIIATPAHGEEIIWFSIADLTSFSRSQGIIADATHVLIPTPPKAKIRGSWEPAAQLLLQLADGDKELAEPPLKDEFREMLRSVWERAGSPALDRAGLRSDELFVELLRQCTSHARDPHAEPPACCVWLAEGFSWVHLPSLLDWLSCPVAKSKHFDWSDARKALLLLGFTYIKDRHRTAVKADGKAIEGKASVWRGPEGLLSD